MGGARTNAVEIGRHDQFLLNEPTPMLLKAPRTGYACDSARCQASNDDTLLPAKGARVGSLSYVDWLCRCMAN